MSVRRVLHKASRAVRELRDLFLACVALVFLAISRLLPERIIVETIAFLARNACMHIPRYYRVGMQNLLLAFPEKSAEERRNILKRSWDNMGRTAAEYFYIDRLWDFDPHASTPGRIESDSVAGFVQLANDGKPAIILSAHLGNWELPMLAATHHGLAAAALYAIPRNRWIANMVLARRQSAMGELIASGPGAMHRLAHALEKGKHLGLLVDQFHIGGPQVKFFGHETKANPIFARLARLYECPVHPVRVIRLPGNRFRIELGEELNLPRDASGRVDIDGSLQIIADVVEGWVREYPEQWIWVHRRWR